MDPLSISASIAGLLALASTVVQYLSAVEESSDARGRLLLEVSSAQGLLYSLKDLCKEIEMPSGCLMSIRSLCAPQGPFDQFKSALELLAARLAPVKGREKVKKAFTWFFDQGEMKALMDVVERQKTYFLLALQGNDIILSQELARSVQRIDLRLQSIQGGVDDLAFEQRRQALRQIRQHDLDVFVWVSPTTSATRHKALLQNVQQGTGLWFLTQHNFLHWLTGPAPSPILWLVGIPGSGKSSLASIIVDHLERKVLQPGIGVSYFFCDYNDTTQTSERFKRSILRQLLQQLENLPHGVETLYQKHVRNFTDPSSAELDEALLVTCGQFSQIFLVVDALDETSGTAHLSDSVLKICRDFHSKIQSLVTSRPTAALKFAMGQAVCIEICAQDQDLIAYTRHELTSRNTLRLFVQKEPTFEDEVISTILRSCKGMFLVARLYIESLAGRHHLRAAKNALKQLPSTLDGLYDNAIDRVRRQPEEDIALAMRIIGWTAYSVNELTIAQLQHALAVEYDSVDLDEDALIDMDLLLSLCAGLIVLDSQDSTVRLVHYTAKEYFDGRRQNIFPQVDCNIARACLQYLSFPSTAGLSASDDDLSRKLSTFPLLEYAAANWGTHLQKCGGEHVELDDMAEAFSSNDGLVAGAVQVMQTSASRHEGFHRNMTTNIRGLHLAAHFGLINLTQRLLEREDINVRDDSGRTPLHWAARANQSQLVQLLLGKGAAVDGQDNVNGTALHLASRFGHTKVVSVLLANGCDVNKANNVGGTALIWVAIGGSQEVATLLLKHGADVRAKSLRGATPLLNAVEENNEGVVQILLQHNSEIDVLDYSGRHSPLTTATSRSNEVIMRMLLEAGAMPDFRTTSGTTALERAATRRDDGPTRLLLHFRADPNAKGFPNGKTPLHFAANNGNLDIVSTLIPRTQLDAVDNHGQTVLHAAINSQNEAVEGKVVRALLDTQKINMEARDTNGWTALTHATYGNLPIIKQLLLDAGADPAFETPSV